jgi:hypothetical protein
MRVWVVIDIGCVECREDSTAVGIFATENDAKQAAEHVFRGQVFGPFTVLSDA